jgi:hypothetical protein
MKPWFVLATLAAISTFTACAVADNLTNQDLSDEVRLQGQIVCSIPEGGDEFCPAFAGPFDYLPNEEIQLFEPGTDQLSDVLYVQDHFLYFVSDVDGVIHDPGFFVVKKLDETGEFQEVGQYLLDTHTPPGPTFVLEVKSDLEQVPEPSTILLAGPALLYFARKSRLWRT